MQMDLFIRCTIILIIRWAPRWLINVLLCSEVPVTSVWEYFRPLMPQAAKLLRPTQVSRSTWTSEDAAARELQAGPSGPFHPTVAQEPLPDPNPTQARRMPLQVFPLLAGLH